MTAVSLFDTLFREEQNSHAGSGEPDTHLAELAAHWIARTPELGDSMRASVALSVLSTFFSLFAMRRGVMIVGSGALSFGDDLKRLPRLVLDFVLVPSRAVARTLGHLSHQAQTRP